MNTITLHITIEVPDDFFDEENYDDNMDIVSASVDDLVDSIGGDLHDLEIK